MRIYSDPSQADDTWTLPDVEVFRVSPMEAIYNQQNADRANEYTIFEPGYYWWTCLPGCLPDSSPFGPYETEAAAIEAAQDIN